MAFEYVPGAAFFPGHGGLGIWVKYARSPHDHIEVMGSGPMHVWLRCPDRELLITSDGHTTNGIRPIDDNWDEYIALGNVGEMVRDFGTKWLMFNYPQHLSKLEHSPRHRRNGGHDNGVKYMSDSGGFQIITGRIDYLDPIKITEWYNENVDMGVVLDIPLPARDKPELLLKLAHVQSTNTRAMLSAKAPHVDLINVAHGRSPAEYDMFRDITETDEINRLCIAGSYHGNVVESISNTMHVMTTGRKYPHYHLLGLYNLSIIPIVMRLAHTGIADLITSDASTHVQSAMGRLYHFQRSYDRPMERVIIGLDKQPTKPINLGRRLPCSCPVCATLLYTDILTTLNGAFISYMLMMHNLFEISRYMTMMDYYAKTYDDKDYAELVKRQLKNHSSSNETLIGLKFLQAAKDEGLAKARQRYRYYSETGLFGDSGKFVQVALFNTNSDEVTSHQMSLRKVIKKVERIVDIYSAGDTKHGSRDRKFRRGKGTAMYNRKRQVTKTKKRKKKTALAAVPPNGQPQVPHDIPFDGPYVKIAGKKVA